MTIIEITKARFEALCFLRLPTAKLFSEEREWYTDQNENVLGVVLFDTVDEDWSYVVLGRDEVARFRGIDNDVSLHTIEEAWNVLHEKMSQYSTAGKHIFSQGVERKGQKVFRIFHPVVATEHLSPDFLVLSKGTGYSPAKQVIAEIAYTFEDPDGNYIQQFQSEGFDARLWELFLYTILHENDFFIDRHYKAPDYVCIKYGQTIVLEATTVNPTQVPGGKQASEETLKGIHLADYMAIKFGSALFSKLQKRYWELNHAEGHPLILAVADFRKPQGVTYSAKFLMEYLYALRQNEEGDSICYTTLTEHIFNEKRIPSGFFYLKDTENIAAVLFSDNGTISKFNRMGKLAGFGSPDVMMIRIGERYENLESDVPSEFRIVVDPSHYKETWSEGIWILHNPNAKYPLARQLFSNAAHVYLENGELITYLTEAFPIWSKTLILSVEEKHKK
jgi:hypothetical protein